MRFTRGVNTFYVTALAWPGATLTLTAGVPIAPRSQVRLLGGGSQALTWHRAANQLVIDLPKGGSGATRSRHAYVFEIRAPAH